MNETSPQSQPVPRPDGFAAAALGVFAATLAIIAVDQLTKHWIATHIQQLHSFSDDYPRIDVIPGFFDIVHHRNFGAAFGILQGQRVFFVVITIVALGLLFWMFRASWRAGERRWTRVAVWPLFLGGAVGNLFDRIRGDGVIDFLHFYYQPLGHYPSFNVADSCICIGIFLLILYALPGRKRSGDGDHASVPS